MTYFREAELLNTSKQDPLFSFLALSLASAYDLREDISFAVKFLYLQGEDNN